MFIQTESTPNPATLKFLPGRVVLEGNPREFLTAEEAVASPLAAALYEIPGVAETCNHEHIARHYYESHRGINPHGIVAKTPAAFQP